MSFTLRPLEEADFDAWYPLWQGYLTFYESAVADDVTRHTFDRMIDPDGDIFGLCAVDDAGNLIGFVTWLFHPFTWSREPRCYLGDLFTSPAARGKGVARALIAAVNEEAGKAGAAQVYWLTQEFNYQGRMLYDKVATRTPFIKYSQKVPAQ